MRQDRKSRIAALECAANQKHNPARLEVIRRDGWVFLYWAGRLVKVLKEALWEI